MIFIFEAQRSEFLLIFFWKKHKNTINTTKNMNYENDYYD